jgi:hypothetical protein
MYLASNIVIDIAIAIIAIAIAITIGNVRAVNRNRIWLRPYT